MPQVSRLRQEELGWKASGRLMSLLLLGVLLLGCSQSASVLSPTEAQSPTVSASPHPSVPSQSIPIQTTTNQTTSPGQMLQLSAQIQLADQVIQLEVARTPEQQEMGLMYRTDLAPDRGMVFPFDPPRRVGFWMKDTLIPLDMVFLLKGKVQAISSNVPPCKADPCPIYGPKALVDQVIELRAGQAEALGLKVDDRIVIQPLSSTP